MKSVFNKIEKEKSKEIEFPVLAEAIGIDSESFVVLFLSNTTGVVVKGNKHNTVGELNNGYKLTRESTKWRILSQEECIVLSND